MPGPLTYGPFDPEEDGQALGNILGRSFAFPPDETAPWLANAGHENVRVLRDGAEPVACLLLIPMGQWFGGRSVPMAGVAAVAVAPHRRGTGAALSLMAAAMRDLHAQASFAISTLYPAAQGLYRLAGYEQAGTRFDVVVKAAGLASGRAAANDPLLEIRPVDPSDLPGIEAAYGELARGSCGYLDRGPYVWRRVFEPRGQTAYGYVAVRGGAIEGYVYLTQVRRPTGDHDLRLTDLIALTPRAYARLLRFLSEQRSLARTVGWYTSPADPMLSLIPEQTYTLTLNHHWMTRIIDVARALDARGYPAGLEAEVHLSVRDAIVPENDGRFVLAVSGGRGEAKRGGRGSLSMDVRALSPLYSGLLSARALRAAGHIEGSDHEIDSACAVFGGPMPAMADMF
jgi:predicted acetyltransferase